MKITKPSIMLNKKTVVNGIQFASKKEADRYRDLRALLHWGHIQNLRLQVKFTLIPALYWDGDYVFRKVKGACIQRETSYIADFVYYDNGEFVVEDVKGCRDKKRSRIYQKFLKKKRMMKIIHGIDVQEV
jgi:hypothetical protein